MLYAQLQTILPYFNAEKVEIENIVYLGEIIYFRRTQLYGPYSKSVGVFIYS